jgi:hypothetical protein
MGILDFEIKRKCVALIVTLLCIIPFFVVIGLPLTIGQPTHDFYDELEKLPEGSKIVWAQQMGSVNYEAYKYGFRAVLLQHAEKGHIVIVCSFEADTPTLLLSLHEWTKAQTGMVYGEDYVVLPYLAGFDTALAAMAENMRLFDTDATGIPIDQLPAMDGINTLNDFDMAITSYGYNDWPEAFIRQWPAKYEIRSMTMLRSFSDITQLWNWKWNKWVY